MTTRADLSSRIRSAARFSSGQQDVINCLRMLAHDVEVAPEEWINDGARSALRNEIETIIVSIEEGRRPSLSMPDPDPYAPKFERQILDAINRCLTSSSARIGADTTSLAPVYAGESALETLTGTCEPSASRSCGEQQAIVAGATIVGGAIGFFAGSFVWGIVGAIAANIVGRKLKTFGAASGTPCLTQSGLDQIKSQIASGIIDQTHAENLARTYDASCPDDAKAIRDAAKAAGPPAPPSGPLVRAPARAPVSAPTFTPTGPSGILYTPPKDTIPHKLTADEAAEEVFMFRSDAGFGDDDDFLNANPAIAVFDPGGEWPPNSPFTYVIEGKYTGAADVSRTYTPTGKIEAGVNVPTYIESDTGHEVYFDFGSYTPFFVKILRGSAPTIATNSGGQRMSLARGVWVWDEGTLVNVKPDSRVAKEAA